MLLVPHFTSTEPLSLAHLGAQAAVVCEHWEKGGEGAVDLGLAVIEACKSSSDTPFKFLYPLDLSIKVKQESTNRMQFHKLS